MPILPNAYFYISLKVIYNCSIFDSTFFVLVSLVRDNLRGLRKNLKHKIPTLDNFEAVDELKSGARRSSSLQYTPMLKDDNSEDIVENEDLAPRSSSLSSR